MIDYFIDPVLRAPTIGSMLMCLAASLMGVLIFVRKRSLVGETLSHATYPGVAFAIMMGSMLGLDESLSFFVLIGAFFSTLLGFGAIHLLIHLKVRSDAALCFVLAAFFGIGVTLSSHIQFVHPSYTRSIHAYLYGQAATMTDLHILIYALLSLIIVTSIMVFYKELQLLSFDREFAKSVNISSKMDFIVLFLTALSIVIGIRCVGVVLISAMLIAPAVAARQYTNCLSKMFVLAAIVGVVSAFMGTSLSFSLSSYFATLYPEWRGSFPTGPMIVLSSSCLACLSLLFAPKRAVVRRLLRFALSQISHKRDEAL